MVCTKENKTAAPGVSASLIAAHSAVSHDIAKAMALGALERCPAELAVAITGVAGPEPEKTKRNCQGQYTLSEGVEP